MTFSEAVKTCLTEKYFKISGRATRSEYWWFQLFYLLLSIGVGVVIGVVEVTAQQDFSIILIGLLVLLMICPLFCVQIRRLHDAGFSGWFVLLSLVPYLGGIALFVMTLLKSDGDNKWGPNPQFTIE